MGMRANIVSPVTGLVRPQIDVVHRLNDGIHLDFARGIHYVKVPGKAATVAPFTSLFTFTGDNKSYFRGTSGLLVPSLTNTPRIEYDSVGNILGLLVEVARTNLVIQSQALDNTTSAWTAPTRASISADATTAPDGTATADKIVEDSTASSTHLIRQQFTKAASALTYSLSFWIKAAGRPAFEVRVSNNAISKHFRAVFDLSTGTVNASSATTWTLVSASITPYANGWYRCTLIGTTDTDTELNIYGWVEAVAGTLSYSGDGTSGLYAWGFQLEQASFPSSYIPTTTASVARAGDTITRTIGSEISQSTGTMFAEFNPYDVSGNNFVVGLDDTTTNEYVWMYHAATATLWRVVDGGATQASISTGATSAGTFHKVAGAYATNDLAVAKDGTLATPDTNGTLPTTTRMTLGSRAGSDALFGHIRRLSYFPERKSNAELQRMTG